MPLPRLFVLSLLLTAGCAPSEPPPAAAASRYVLRAIGHQPVQPGDSLRGCQDRPVGGSYRLAAGRWVSVDTIGACPAADRHEPVVRIDSGTYQLRGDTIALAVSDTRLGAAGVIGLGLFRADTLRLWGSDLDGGDYIFTREGS